ncbi:MAG: hypothetical protein UHD09_07320 [Bifidobacterium sp.]|nr:hypothetical protein [Bifidobacterium sp.]
MYRFGTIARLGAVALMTLAVAATSACGTTTPQAAPTTTVPQAESSQATQEPVEAADELYWSGVNGPWVQQDTDADATHLEAQVSGTPAVIAINWAGADGEALYWRGTFHRPQEEGDWSWTSHADSAQNSLGPRACQDASKDFTYDHASRQLIFEAEIDGQRRTVTMARP